MPAIDGIPPIHSAPTLINFLTGMLLLVVLTETNTEKALSALVLITPITAQQLALVSAIFGCTELIGFALLWSGHSSSETRKHMRYYRAAAIVMSMAFMAAASPARIAGKTLEAGDGWYEPLAWVLYLTMVDIMCIKIVTLCVSDLRHKPGNARDVTVLLSILIAAGGALVIGSQWIVLSLLDNLGWTNTADYRLLTNRINFLASPISIFILGIIPLATLAIRACGFDSTTRNWNKLQPARTALIAAAPNCVFYTDDDDVDRHRRWKSGLQLHHSVIEMRDAIWRLRPYLPTLAEHELSEFLDSAHVPSSDYEAAAYALRVRRAITAKACGGATSALSGAAEDVPPPRAATLDEEIFDLLGLAKWWEAATQKEGTA